MDWSVQVPLRWVSYAARMYACWRPSVRIRKIGGPVCGVIAVRVPLGSSLVVDTPQVDTSMQIASRTNSRKSRVNKHKTNDTLRLARTRATGKARNGSNDNKLSWPLCPRKQPRVSDVTPIPPGPSLHLAAPNASTARLSYPGVRSECRVALVIPSFILGTYTCETGRPEMLCAFSPTVPSPCHGNTVRRAGEHQAGTLEGNRADLSYGQVCSSHLHNTWTLGGRVCVWDSQLRPRLCAPYKYFVAFSGRLLFHRPRKC